MVRHKINKTVQKISGQKVVTTTISLLILFGIIIILTAIFAILLFANNQEILSKSLGEHSLLSSILSKYGEIIKSLN